MKIHGGRFQLFAHLVSKNGIILQNELLKFNSHFFRNLLFGLLHIENLGGAKHLNCAAQGYWLQCALGRWTEQNAALLLCISPLLLSSDLKLNFYTNNYLENFISRPDLAECSPRHQSSFFSPFFSFCLLP